jgi:3-hydroxyacyl-CoA dehydrogenase
MFMSYQIRKAAVIGSGTMGGGIASLLAGVNIPVVLLDIPAPDTTPDSPKAKRNAIVLDNFKKLQKSRPAQFFEEADWGLVTVGNTEDDLDKLSDADWIIEVIVENLAIKQSLMARLDAIRKPGAIVTTNTSGLSIAAIAEGRSDDFHKHFLGTHFFNPPRYLKLLEIIPHPETDPSLTAFMMEFGATRLGKGTVLCKNTPNFIANRFISIIGSVAVNYAIEHGYSVEEIDEISGPLIGHPKTATFRLQDLVGIDIHVHVAENLYTAIPDDEWREVIHHEGATKLYKFLMENKFLGRKTNQGFYKQARGADGDKIFKPLNLQTLEYDDPKEVSFESVNKHRKIRDLGARIKALINEDDRAGQFLWHLHAASFVYAALKLGEIADSLVDIDNANKWGFAHEMGPFEIWDAVGVAETLPRLKADNYKLPAWVQEMVDGGVATFYQRDAKGIVTGYYDPQHKGYVSLVPDKRVIVIPNLKANGKVVDTLPGASLLDMGDGVALLEFHSKANSIEEDVMTMAQRAIARLNSDFDGLVVGNDGSNFSVGANLFLIFMLAQGEQWDDIDRAARTLQDVAQAFRYASKPVVTAPFGMTLGGGAEVAMAGTRIVAHAETYMGLVEIGVGIIPAGSGCLGLLKRVVNPVMEATEHAEALAHLQKIFENIAMAKVSESAMQARQMGFLGPQDRIVMNREHLLAEAKREVLHLIPGFVPVVPGKVYAAGRDIESAMKIGAWMLNEAGYATDHEKHIADHLAYVLTGGGLSEPQWVDEQYILDLERAALVELVKHPKTQERIQYMLQNNKPLRN